MSATGRRALDRLRSFGGGLRRTEHLFMVLVSIVIGLLGGLGAVGFRELIRLVNIAAWHHGQYTIEYLEGLPPWWKLLAPGLGGLVVGLVTWRIAGEVKGHGVPEVMEAVALRAGRIRPRVVIAKMIASAVSIGSGGSVGREGPIVQVGSAMGSAVGQWLKLDPRRLRTLVGCGAAAGIAATFNAPVAGALFAVEVILGDFGVAQFSPIVISSVAGTVVSQHFLGDFPAFQVPTYSLIHPGELFAYTALGALAGLTAVLFCRTLYATENIFDRAPALGPLRPMIGGALVGTIGIGLPHVYGVGYEAINEALTGSLSLQLVLLLLAAKLAAVSITIGSGGSGGIFAPSLFLGAMLGGAVGTVMHSVWPQATATPGAYALVGMGAVVAAGTHAPITAIVIIFELTGDYKIILPLMVSCIIATMLAMRLQTGSIYTLKLLRRGVDIRGGRAVNLLRNVAAREVMRPDMATVAPGDSLSHLITVFVEHPGHTLFVVDDASRLLGVITSGQLRPAMGDAASLSSLVIAEDIMDRGAVPATAPDESLADVMRLLGTYQGEVPVLQDGRLIGVIRPQDVIERYNTELFKRDMASGLVDAATRQTNLAFTPAVENAVLAEVPVPAAFVGRSIKELDVRRNFGFSVLIIKRRSGEEQEALEVIPAADFVFRSGDVMLALGPGDELDLLRRGASRADLRSIRRSVGADRNDDLEKDTP